MRQLVRVFVPLLLLCAAGARAPVGSVAHLRYVAQMYMNLTR